MSVSRPDSLRPIRVSIDLRISPVASRYQKRCRRGLRSRSSSCVFPDVCCNLAPPTHGVGPGRKRMSQASVQREGSRCKCPIDTEKELRINSSSLAGFRPRWLTFLGHLGEQAIDLLGLERYRAQGAPPVPGEQLPQQPAAEPAVGVVDQGRGWHENFRLAWVTRRILMRTRSASQTRRAPPPEVRGDWMDQHTGQHANAAIFAANGAARHRLLKAASAASLTLLAAWLIALALGVWGGFGSLPGLPSFHSTGPSEASSRTQHPPAPSPAQSHPQSHPQSHQSARAVRTASPSPAGSGTSGTGSGTGTGSGSGTTHSQGSNPMATAPQPVESPSTSSAPPSTSQGQGTTTTTEVPTDSPGSLPSGSEMPGQLP